MVAVKRKKKDLRRRIDQASHPVKISEMVWEFAGDFIRMGDSEEDRHSRLTAACSAWNMACAPVEKRAGMLDQYMTGFKRYNRDADEATICAVRQDMETLIDRKLRLFPTVIKQIVGAWIHRVGGQDRIEVASARVQ